MYYYENYFELSSLSSINKSVHLKSAHPKLVHHKLIHSKPIRPKPLHHKLLHPKPIHINFWYEVKNIAST